MVKKSIVFVLLVLFLPAYTQATEHPVPEGFTGPNAGPDLANIKPTVGPNDSQLQ